MPTLFRRDRNVTRLSPSTELRRQGWGLLFIVLLGVNLSLPVNAQMYKYQDEEGIWHFSDKRPQGETGPRPASDVPVTAQQQVIIHRTGNEDAPVFEASNTLPAPIELEFSTRQLQNMRARPPLPLRKVIPAGSRVTLTHLSVIDPDAPWRYAYVTRFALGDPQAKHLTGKPYLPPFSAHKEFIISQAFDGERSHRQHPLTRYAVDIAMPEESAVHAARSGTLVEIKTGRLSPKHSGTTTYLRILHRDGTFGLYAHLDPGTIKLMPGMTLNRGQVIGRLAEVASGEATHLHFAVQKNSGMQLESIPFTFTSLDGAPVEPKTDLQLRHPL